MFPKPKAPRSGGVQWKGSSSESGSWLGSATKGCMSLCQSTHFPQTFKGGLVQFLKGLFKFLSGIKSIKV